MGVRGGQRRILGILSMIIAFAVIGASAWLLIVAMNESYCQGYDRSRGYDPYGGSGSYGTNTFRGYNSDSSYGYGNNDRYGAGRRRDGNYEGGVRSREWFCEFVVEKWTTASWITICVGIFQALLSVAYVIASWGDNAYTAPKIWTIFWIICNFIFLVGALAGIIISTQAEIFTSYQTRSFLGALYVGVVGFDAFICFLFPVLAFFLVLRKINDVEDVESYDERPNSRTEFIRQQQQQQGLRPPAKATNI